MAKPKQSINLSTLAKGMAGLSATKGRELAEAACVCLDRGQHQPGVTLVVTGHIEFSRALIFKTPSDQLRCTYADPEEATESGACAVAIVVVSAETGLQVIERAIKTTGIDYWLGKTRFDFQARLEVSGILKGTENEVNRRTEQKLAQMKRSDDSGLPGYAAVVEFGQPRMQVESK